MALRGVGAIGSFHFLWTPIRHNLTSYHYLALSAVEDSANFSDKNIVSSTIASVNLRYSYHRLDGVRDSFGSRRNLNMKTLQKIFFLSLLIFSLMSFSLLRIYIQPSFPDPRSTAIKPLKFIVSSWVKNKTSERSQVFFCETRLVFLCFFTFHVLLRSTG